MTKTLVEFVKQSRKVECAICNLPADIRAQVREAGSKDITRRQVRDWLAAECQILIKEADQMAHGNGHHDS